MTQTNIDNSISWTPTRSGLNGPIQYIPLDEHIFQGLLEPDSQKLKPI